MNLGRNAAALLLALCTLLVPGGPAGAVALPQVVGSGFLAAGPGAGNITFNVAVDGQQTPYFELWDYASDPPRNLVLTEVSEVKCLGQMFGGQAIQLSGSSSDSASPGETLKLQVFLVDGAAAGADRISVKLQRADGRVVYFAPMRDLDSGDLSVSCAG
jgi:hypothetical protein